LTAKRGNESTFHTSNDLKDSTESNATNWIEKRFDEISVNLNNDFDLNSVINAWKECEAKVSPLVYELCEQLQLVLEPTKTAKMKGDYRNGKRLNMRKVIAYIASDFRKDKIWLRRTKPSKRQYQIVIAVDDSLSMADNQSKQLAFESLALLGKSLSLLEAGELAIMSFGEIVKLLHSFSEPFTDNTGAKLLFEVN
jgi:midasin